MRKMFRDSLFLKIYLVFLFAGIGLAVFFDKGEIFLWVNNHHSEFQDFFFKYITWLGDGLFVFLIALVLFFFHFGRSFLVFLSLAIGGGFTQILKKLVFPEIVRPSKYFTEIDLHYVEEVVVNSAHSFPSGHTATAFALFCILSLMFRNKWLTITFFIFALLVAYSRLYLVQHFFIDTLAGSFIGVFAAIFIIIFIFKKDYFKRSKVANFSLRALLKPDERS